MGLTSFLKKFVKIDKYCIISLQMATDVLLKYSLLLLQYTFCILAIVLYIRNRRNFHKYAPLPDDLCQERINLLYCFSAKYVI